MNEHEGHRKRLRESFMERGVDGMHDHQVLELLLTYSIPRKDTNVLAHALIKRFGSLREVCDADPHALMQVEGIGESAAVLLSLTGAIARQIGWKARTGAGLSTPWAAMEYCRGRFGESRYEAMHVISLDKNRRILHVDLISSGTLTETAVYPRLVVEVALRHQAHSVILTHNHPSGEVRPSRNDIETTMHILRALEPIGIRLYDHIITSRGNAFSMMRDMEMLQAESAAEMRLVSEKEET